MRDKFSTLEKVFRCFFVIKLRILLGLRGKFILGKRHKDHSKPANHLLPTGRVIGRLGPVFTIEYDGADIACVAKGRAKTAVVGDWVRFDPTADTELANGLLVSVESRRNCLKRTDALGRKAQFIAANLSHIVIVCACEPPVREGLIDRYLVSARMEGLAASILFNKTDLMSSEVRSEYAERLSHYEMAGHDLFFASSVTGEGFEQLEARLEGEISILVGHSGVGKTSIINRLLPTYDGRTNVLSAATNKGQHTTTASWLHRLPKGGELIDTPGIRSFGLYGVTKQTVANHFPDFDQIDESCHFHNCTHQHEPKCAVIRQVEAGNLPLHRYEAYLSLIESLGQ